MPHTVVLHHVDVCVCTYVQGHAHLHPHKHELAHLELNALPLAYTHVPHTMCVDVTYSMLGYTAGPLIRGAAQQVLLSCLLKVYTPFTICTSRRV